MARSQRRKKRPPARNAKAAARRKPPKKRGAPKKPARRARAPRRTKPKRAKAARAKVASSKTKKASTPKKRKRSSAARGRRGKASPEISPPLDPRGVGPEAGGQSGDTEGVSRDELADSESVEELLEEGQAFEAGIVEGVENAPDADQGEVRTREVPEDDVPQEYLDED